MPCQRAKTKLLHGLALFAAAAVQPDPRLPACCMVYRTTAAGRALLLVLGCSAVVASFSGRGARKRRAEGLQAADSALTNPPDWQAPSELAAPSVPRSLRLRKSARVFIAVVTLAASSLVFKGLSDGHALVQENALRDELEKNGVETIAKLGPTNLRRIWSRYEVVQTYSFTVGDQSYAGATEDGRGMAFTQSPPKLRYLAANPAINRLEFPRSASTGDAAAFMTRLTTQPSSTRRRIRRLICGIQASSMKWFSSSPISRHPIRTRAHPAGHPRRVFSAVAQRAGRCHRILGSLCAARANGNFEPQNWR